MNLALEDRGPPPPPPVKEEQRGRKRTPRDQQQGKGAGQRERPASAPAWTGRVPAAQTPKVPPVTPGVFYPES